MAEAGRDAAQLQTLVAAMYQGLGLVDRWSIEPQMLKNFLQA